MAEDNKSVTTQQDNTDNSKSDNNSDNEFDFTKLSDAQILKVLEDQRVWNTPRLKELRDAAKKAKQYEVDNEKRIAEELKKKGEFEALAKANEDKAKDWESKYSQSLINNKIMQEAGKQGITRLDLVEKLIDRTNIKLDENGNIAGVSEAISALIKDNEFLKTGGKDKLGSGSNPIEGNGIPEFTLSQIQDPIFYQANRDKIMRAQAKGRIIDDRK